MCQPLCSLLLSGFLSSCCPFPQPLASCARVWGSAETHVNVTFSLPIPKDTSLGFYWQWKGRQTGQFLGPALSRRGIKWVSITLLHLYTLPQACDHPGLHLRTEVDSVSEGRGIHRLQRSREKIPKQQLGEILKVVSAWKFVTCHTLPL